MKYFLCMVWVLIGNVSLSHKLVAQQLQTNIPCHDPVIIQHNGKFYLFCTGPGITIWSTTDLKHWNRLAPVFASAPAWTVAAVPNFKNHMWAPDISFFNGKYYLYYSVSSFGKNTSCIGLATNSTLDPLDKNYRWEDQGLVIQSVPGKTNWNAIDPNLIVDEKGIPFLAFGSFWHGLHMVRLAADRKTLAQSIDSLTLIATRKTDPMKQENAAAVDSNPPDAGGNAIEAPFIFKKGKFYYLFASVDYCCKGVKSNYRMITGRSEKAPGPYIDREGKAMNRGGGTPLLSGNKDWYGVGHNAVCTVKGEDLLVFHGYEAADNGKPKLRIEKLIWKGGWPEVVGK